MSRRFTQIKQCLYALTAVAFLLLMQACVKSVEADLVVHNATIYTLDGAFSTAQAMAIKDGRIIETGADREILNRYRAANTYDARKMYVYPGFHDAHSHFTGFARNMAELNLYGVSNPQELVQRVKSFAGSSGREWVVGRGWDQNLWPDKQFPTRTLLDSLFPERPILLTRVDGHAALANGAALRKVGITAATEVAGGSILIGSDGYPNGMLIDRAVDRVQRFIPKLGPEVMVDLLQKAQKQCFSAGLTMVSDAGLSVKEIDFLDSLQREGLLSIRIYASLRPDDQSLARMEQGPYLTDRLIMRSVKLYADGALGSRGALLKAPYNDDEGNYGLLLMPQDELDFWAEACMRHGFQLNTHAIGDSANALVLHTYARHLKEINDMRWRIEHAQIVDAADQHLFGTYAIIPSVQPVHATSDAAWAPDRLGNSRLKYAYAFESLRKQLGWIALGTDFPVEAISPLATFCAAVFRVPLDAPETAPFQPDEALSRAHALRGISQWPAIAAFAETELGTLEIGSRADFVVLNRDLMSTDVDGLRKAKVMATFIDGLQVH